MPHTVTGRVLIIEDHPEVGPNLERILAGRGFDVRLEQDGYGGLAAVEAFRPDVVLLDVMLGSPPGRDPLFGDEVLRQITAKAFRTKVIVMTGHYKDLQSILKFVKLGAADFISKPFVIDDMVATIKRVLLLESTSSLVVSQPAPLISEYLERTQKILDLEGRGELAGCMAKAGYVGFAVAMLVVLSKAHVVTHPFALFAIFLCMILPMDRVTKLAAGFLGGRTEIFLEGRDPDARAAGTAMPPVSRAGQGDQPEQRKLEHGNTLATKTGRG